jgi:isopenicillin N synthase-like dioxygenase
LSIPLIDIADFDSMHQERCSDVVRQWCETLDSIGFVTIRGHGIPEHMMATLHREACAFFEQPLEQKLVHGASDPDQRGAIGYIPPMGESVGRTSGDGGTPDIVESLSFSNLATATRGSGQPLAQSTMLRPALCAAAEAYANEAYALGLRLMRLSATALGVPPTFFDPLYSPMQHKLRLAYYPEQLVAPVPGQLRNAAHTDFAGFTILLQDSAPGGLQVQLPDASWTDVPSIPGSLVINTGDLLQRWTNDRWVSNVHRVVNPPVESRGSSRRLSIVFFTGPRDDAEIACIPGCETPDRPGGYPPLTAGEHIRGKIRQTYGE